MILTRDMYVPAIRWRQGEYQALLRLSKEAKDRIKPLITIPEIEFDFEEWKPKKSVQEHVRPFASRYKAKWGKRPAWIGVHASIASASMDNGSDIYSYVFDALRDFEASAVPAVPLSATKPTLSAVAAIVKLDGLGCGVVLGFEDLMKPGIKTRIFAWASGLGLALGKIDLLVDLGAPNFEPYDTFSVALVAALRKIGDLSAFRNLVLIGTAIPESFKNVAKGEDQIPRHDWLFYRALMVKLPADVRRPNFGDYTIVHPDFAPIDMRKIKSAGKLVYTTSSNWEVRKGGAFRDKPEQMHTHCASILSSGKFKDAGYSSGDDYIAKCAVGQVGPSNQSRWKEVAINHHMTHVLEDLATLGGAP